MHTIFLFYACIVKWLIKVTVIEEQHKELTFPVLKSFQTDIFALFSTSLFRACKHQDYIMKKDLISNR